MKANVALRTQGEVFKALTRMVHVLPTANQVGARLIKSVAVLRKNLNISEV